MDPPKGWGTKGCKNDRENNKKPADPGRGPAEAGEGPTEGLVGCKKRGDLID